MFDLRQNKERQDSSQLVHFPSVRAHKPQKGIPMLGGARNQPDARQTQLPACDQRQSPQAQYQSLKVQKARSGKDSAERFKEHGKL